MQFYTCNASCLYMAFCKVEYIEIKLSRKQEIRSRKHESRSREEMRKLKSKGNGVANRYERI